MGRSNSVLTHPKRAQIDADLSRGDTLASIAARYGSLSISALSRYAISRKAALAKLAEADSYGILEISAELREIANSARQLRVHADLSGSPAEKARALKVELEAIRAIGDMLGIDDLTYADLHAATGQLVNVLQEYARDHPERVADLIHRMRAHEPLRDLADNLAGRN